VMDIRLAPPLEVHGDDPSSVRPGPGSDRESRVVGPPE
jgi:hypothetical protein